MEKKDKLEAKVKALGELQQLKESIKTHLQRQTEIMRTLSQVREQLGQDQRQLNASYAAYQASLVELNMTSADVLHHTMKELTTNEQKLQDKLRQIRNDSSTLMEEIQQLGASRKYEPSNVCSDQQAHWLEIELHELDTKINQHPTIMEALDIKKRNLLTQLEVTKHTLMGHESEQQQLKQVIDAKEKECDSFIKKQTSLNSLKELVAEREEIERVLASYMAK